MLELMMKLHVFRWGKNHKVLDSIIKFITVNMVNLLCFKKLSPKVFFHNKPMFVKVAFPDINNLIASLVNNTTLILRQLVSTKSGLRFFMTSYRNVVGLKDVLNNTMLTTKTLAQLLKAVMRTLQVKTADFFFSINIKPAIKVPFHKYILAINRGNCNV